MRLIRSEFAAHAAMREAAQTLPRAASVRLLYTAKRRRDVAREARARLAWRILGALILPALFIIATR